MVIPFWSIEMRVWNNKSIVYLVKRLIWTFLLQYDNRYHVYTVKPVCSDHLYNKIHHLLFIQ